MVKVLFFNKLQHKFISIMCLVNSTYLKQKYNL